MSKIRLGLIVAIEMDCVFDYYKNIEKLDCPRGFELYHCPKDNADIYILRTGMGEVASAAGVQYLAARFGIDALINFGVVGGLTENMQKCKLCAVSRVVHYRYDCSEFLDLEVGQVDGYDSKFILTDERLLKKALEIKPELQPVTCCSADKFVSKAEDKNDLHTKFEGDICDMESAGIVLTCKANDLPCLLIKAVSDGLSGGANEFFTELYNASTECLKVADEIIESLGK